MDINEIIEFAKTNTNHTNPSIWSGGLNLIKTIYQQTGEMIISLLNGINPDTHKHLLQDLQVIKVNKNL